MSAQQVCPACSTPLVGCGPPINSNYCPNKSCTHDWDEMCRQLRENGEKRKEAERIRDAAPDLLEALEALLAGVDRLLGKPEPYEGDGPVIAAARAAIAKARGEVA